MKNKRWSVLLRVLNLPFVFIIILISSLVGCVKNCYRFVIYGGELSVYEDKHEYNTITDIYRELKNKD